MSASGTVIPGQTYHMKFVVGDRNDSSFDSAVFLSKFDIGNVDLGTDLTVTGNSALCVGQSYIIDSGLTNPPYEFTWYHQAPGAPAFVELVGQTGPTLTVTVPGDYKLVAHYIGSACVGEDTILVEFYPDLFLNTPEPNDLSICSSATNAVFDLTQNTPVVLASFPTPSDYIVTYFLTEADALANTNAIATPNAYTNMSNPQTIWMRIYSTVTFCSGIKNFDIQIVSPPSSDITYNSSYCFNANTATVTLVGTTGGTYSIIGSPANISVDNNGSVTWNNLVTPGTYTIYYAVGTAPCNSDDSFTFTIDAPITASFTSTSTNICQGDSSIITFTGTPLATITYNDGTSNQTVVLDAAGNATISHSGGTKTYTLVNVVLGTCTQVLTGSVVITETPVPQFNITGECVGSQFVLTANIANPQDYSFEWRNNANIVVGTNTNTLLIDEPGNYSCTVTNLSGFICSSVVVELFDNVFCTIQKGISPNGDGLNDYLKLVANKVEIFNRYGKSVYVKTNYNNDWHGQFQGGGQMPDGTYYYVIELASGDVKTGWIYINYEN